MNTIRFQSATAIPLPPLLLVLTHIEDIPENGIGRRGDGGCGRRGGIVRRIDVAQFLIDIVVLHIGRRRTVQIDQVAVDAFPLQHHNNK